MDIFTQFHHVIWMGDLNYRIDFDNSSKGRTQRTPTQNMFTTMVDIIQKGEVLTLATQIFSSIVTVIDMLGI